MAKLFFKNLTQQVHLIDWRNEHGRVEYSSVPPGERVQIGPDQDLATLERIAERNERRGAVPEVSLPLRPDFIGLAWAIEDTEVA
jgi:hypothetical protein